MSLCLSLCAEVSRAGRTMLVVHKTWEFKITFIFCAAVHNLIFYVPEVFLNQNLNYQREHVINLITYFLVY